ncbi:hypothetical protein AaE_015553 [Aphanomyces astaci]|uniref:HTH CENPB-type domain-containing protein n=1 Tax=Aphanomyces astaci TaxID=112090 RepID=A0A6A4YWW4_APHAT|nr:hypothetical protein AaE_015553 [Aphanomyces astaci]
MAPKTAYSADDMSKAIDDVLKRVDTVANIAMRHGVPLRTLHTHVHRSKAMEATVAPLRTGPPPSLPTSYEDDLVTWILGMETDGHAVGRKQIIQKATAILEVIHGFPPAQPLTRGWYHRFMARHPELKRKKAQTLSAARSAITPDSGLLPPACPLIVMRQFRSSTHFQYG